VGLLQDQHREGDHQPAVAELARDVGEEDPTEGRMVSKERPQFRERLHVVHIHGGTPL